MSTLDRAQRRYDSMEAPGYYDEDGELNPDERKKELQKAFDAGFDAACDYWENPMQYMEVDINVHQDREREKVIKLLG